MIIKHIAEEKCSVCGALPLRESRSATNHCNGQQFEEREFACGRRVEWIPNFERSHVRKECPLHPAQLAAAAVKIQSNNAIVAVAREKGWTVAKIAELEHFLEYHS